MLTVFVTYDQMDNHSVIERDTFINKFDKCIADDIRQRFILIKRTK